MPLPKLLRTSSFRLTLLYAALTGASFLFLFGVIFWSTERFMERQIDAVVDSEIAEIQADAREQGVAGLRGIVEGLISRVPGYFYLLQDASGVVLAGNLSAMDPVVGVREWSGASSSQEERSSGIRGRGVIVAGGTFLFVGISTFQMNEMRATVSRSFLWGLGAAVLLALLGGAAMSLSVLRRIEAVSRTSREIVSGDLTRRIAVRGSGDEFDHLAASLNVMLDRIEALMEGLRQVSTDIAHDLRTPLTRLRQRLELVQRRGNPAERYEQVVDATLQDIDAILETFGALLRIAQIESGARSAGFAQIELGELLRTVVEVYQPAMEEKDQTHRQSIAGELVVEGDRELLTQLFANLLENASRHTPASGHIEVSAQTFAGDVVVIVSDNGPGIPAGMRAKVLERFFRLEESRTTPGSGLGLSLVAAVVGLHGATLELTDNAPGLRVVVRMPTARLAERKSVPADR